MNKNQIYIVTSISGFILTALLIFYFVTKRKKKMSIIVKGEYIVPKNIVNRIDALHSFESRKSDGFGGKMSTKIKNELIKLYKQGINPKVANLKITIDSKLYKVNWEAEIVPSENGKAYIGFMTFGSAGNNADSRAIGQEVSVKKRIGGENYELVLDFKNPNGIYIRQFFYQYTKQKDFPNN